MITIKDVEHVAKLARLELTEDEKELYTKQLFRDTQIGRYGGAAQLVLRAQLLNMGAGL